MTRAAAVCFAAGVLVAWMIGQLNHFLAPVHLSVWSGALGFAFAALYLTPREAWVATLALGLWQDAAATVPFGTHMLLYGTGCAVLLQIRDRLPREERAVIVGVVLVLNLALFLGMSLWLVDDAPDAARAWLRLLADLICTQLTLALATDWVFRLQRATLLWANASLPPDSPLRD